MLFIVHRKLMLKPMQVGSMLWYTHTHTYWHTKPYAQLYTAHLSSTMECVPYSAFSGSAFFLDKGEGNGLDSPQWEFRCMLPELDLWCDWGKHIVQYSGKLKKSSQRSFTSISPFGPDQGRRALSSPCYMHHACPSPWHDLGKVGCAGCHTLG